MSKCCSQRTDVFVGGSLSSLILATHHKITNPENEVIILDGASKVGGDNGSYLAKNGEFFDYGMRVYYECNVKELDDIVARSLPAPELVFLKDNKKDPAACYFNGKLQFNSPCLDLRTLSCTEKNLIIEQINNSKKNINKSNYKNCAEYLTDRLGKIISEKYLFPILENFYGRKPEELTVDASTAHFGLNERVILFEENKTLQLMEDEHLRMRIAFPNQRHLPEPYSRRSARGIYPARLGMQHIINGLKENFLALGGKIILNANIQSVGHNNGLISVLNYTDKNTGNLFSINLQGLFWGAPLQLLAKFLGYESKFELERGKRAHLAHVILNKKLNLSELYYLFNFDPSYEIFRVVNYSAYCPHSCSDGLFRATVEYWSNSDKINIQKINEELRDMCVLDKKHKLIFHELTAGPAFPLQSVKNEELMDDVRKYVQSLALRNLLAFGPSAKKHSFYTPDILRGAFEDYGQFSF